MCLNGCGLIKVDLAKTFHVHTGNYILYLGKNKILSTALKSAWVRYEIYQFKYYNKIDLLELLWKY